MNKADEGSVIQFFTELLTEPGLADAPVVAFDSTKLSGRMRNVRSTALLEVLNDFLATNGACRTLKGIYTVCEFEGRVWFLIKADRAISVTPLFIPDSKIVK